MYCTHICKKFNEVEIEKSLVHISYFILVAAILFALFIYFYLLIYYIQLIRMKSDTHEYIPKKRV